ncbi:MULTISPECIES: nitroreductase family protein [Gammaproteobacteria]|jgi:nitroreductase|uniref:nitroreductase family protein n=1 Tax=Gammaproteobacteria TaxID=1236 RepID=UPI000D01214A|nr:MULTISPECIES: nitroreductase family protein [Gammaproteobacteria]HCA9872221.1 nitroreductase family protein [Klebsiella pneumoniae]EJA3269560.1 nitroreductase family protein [Pseudomonas aeruginosa]EKU0579516.1 nitroreductase family protein [Pseudomonas aeruginosa]ELM5224888.1 nitroreductase family protein [Pseudomonas aeruginosa]ELP1421599.1 nitroreductase family protein [Pseudomonas aeruginosa]
MTNPIQHAIESRTSVNFFQPDRPLDQRVIQDLVAQATKAPSAYNLQNWRFIAVRSADAKASLQSASFGQQKIMDASVAFIVCGTLAAYTKLATALYPSVEARIMEQHMVDEWVAQVSATHKANPALQRDEAIRSASLAAMTLMLAAQGMGLGSCAMSGFDAQQVSRAFGLDATELPVMIVTVGHAADDNWPQKPRRALTEILSIV